MARQSLTSDAIVLRSIPYRDADVILTLLTRERGRLSALARSARKSQKRFGSCLQLFSVSSLQLSTRGGELWTLNSAQLLSSHADLAQDMASFAHASYGTELVRELTTVEVQDPGVFDLIVALYRELSDRGASALVLRAFEIALLGLVGLAPVLDRCVGCGTDHIHERAVLDPDRGGVCCAICAAMSRGAGVRPVSVGALMILQAVERVPSLEAARAVSTPTPGDAAEARDILVTLLLSHIGKPLRSLEFIAKVSGAARHNRGHS